MEPTRKSKNSTSTLVLIILVGSFLILTAIYLNWRSDSIKAMTPMQYTTSTRWPQETVNIPATLTNISKPTKTPPAPPTPDTRTNYEKCAQSGASVVYLLYGSALYGSMTWNNATNGTEQGDWDIPFCYAYNGFQTGDFAYISIQIGSDYGDVTCEILHNNQVIAKAHADGFASIATCSTSVP